MERSANWDIMRKWLLIGFAAALLAAGCGNNDGTPGGGSGFDIDRNSPGSDAGTSDVDEDTDEADTTAPGAAVGVACDAPSECEGARCLDSEDFPRGYCTTDSCETSSDCPDASVCMNAAEETFCAAECTSDADCRAGYQCLANEAGEGGCGPITEDIAVDGSADGEACESDADCAGGTCITGEGWADGYCTTTQCEDRTDCARGEGGDQFDNRCYRSRQGPFCVRMCDSNADCRDGYECYPVNGGDGFCGPKQSADFDFGDLASYPFDITCGVTVENQMARFDYEIAQDTTSYMVTPFLPDGGQLAPDNVVLPDDTVVDFRGNNSFQLATAQIFGVLSPLIMPAIDAFSSQAQPGVHSMEVETDASELCYYKLEESTPGTTIDLNIHLVGLPDVDASTAPNDADFQATIDEFDRIYQQVGLEIGNINYIDVTGDAATEFSIVRSQRAVQELVATSTRPAGGYDEALSANIFFVQGMELGGAIGISMGLPGPAGLHGTPASGVVFTSEYMGRTVPDRFTNSDVDGNEFTGLIIAHEVGHYLGLFHTTEQDGRGTDPVDDTAECDSSDFPSDCPDLNNLMFPLAGKGHTEVSAGQTFMMKSNPLTKD
ncbi:MAG: hypothetical protein ACQEVA_21095 [Myxococcota bacterium]